MLHKIEHFDWCVRIRRPKMHRFHHLYLESIRIPFSYFLFVTLIVICCSFPFVIISSVSVLLFRSNLIAQFELSKRTKKREVFTLSNWKQQQWKVGAMLFNTKIARYTNTEKRFKTSFTRPICVRSLFECSIQTERVVLSSVHQVQPKQAIQLRAKRVERRKKCKRENERKKESARGDAANQVKREWKRAREWRAVTKEYYRRMQCVRCCCNIGVIP